MHKHYLHAFALLGGLGLLAACPPATGTTTGTDTDTDTDTSSSTTDISTTNTPTTNPPTTDTTTDEPTSTTASTTDPTTGSSSSTTGVDSALCEALGGTAGITDLVGAALTNVLGDDRINGYFLNSDVDQANLATCLEKQLGQVAGCAGVTYDCMDMTAAHAGLGISTIDFMDFGEDFVAALDAHQMAHPTLSDMDKSTIATALTDLAPEIVEDANNDATVYQRVGRKPAIKTLIGAPGAADSFVDNVALDVAINGFFDATDFERLNTCLTRQVAGIDGPTKYGMEVDAPAGIDPGVGAGNPCKTMAAAHEGLVDVGDQIGIDINDFNALVADLITAMTTAGVAQGDQDAILAALGPMCEDIVMPESKNDCPSAQKLETVEAAMIAGMAPLAGYDGTLETMYCHDLVVPDDPINFVKDITVTAAIGHTWAGDITIKLVSPDDKILTIASRPGYNEANDNGSGCCGANADISPTHPLIFKDSAMQSAEAIGSGLGMAQVVCMDDGIDPCEWSPFPGAGPGANFADFYGDAAAGTWRFCIGDTNMTDAGVLDAVKFDVLRVKYDPMP